MKEQRHLIKSYNPERKMFRWESLTGMAMHGDYSLEEMEGYLEKMLYYPDLLVGQVLYGTCRPTGSNWVWSLEPYVESADKPKTLIGEAW